MSQEIVTLVVFLLVFAGGMVIGWIEGDANGRRDVARRWAEADYERERKEKQNVDR